MSEMIFETPVFIKEIRETAVDTVKTPFFYNDGGVPTYLSELPTGITPLVPAVTNPAMAMGNEYIVADVMGVKQTPPYGVETQLGFAASEVAFAPLWATRDVAAAFGITLVEPGQAVMLSSPVVELQQIEYEYGVFAGHWSPYQDTGRSLLSVVCTDLEHHNFPHVFASTDPTQPLVTSVARYWPKLGVIRLADLWVPRGSALYIPPKPASAQLECIDLHNNRNSARACWGDIRQNSIVTQTLLQNDNGFFYWYWNALPTTHGKPVTVG
ncbi:hypothetical protein SAMN02745857_00525 [Andreprevotia lacus DSM 23236]|jgi:hypothetical protein|uniref:Uncharacterized protein n=1 Tax=Andreprevotia lacus DSM 23236 TaxID=1121001 RepID=A0A1W1X3E0_9NEIS|nr:hypothetical protein [Andreprevotia lacus]SMC18310.1 hypothetical protein SAMN02745857_00525 [Andreprevotia lacus DSM 23236]